MLFLPRGCLDASIRDAIRDAIRNAFGCSLTCMIGMPMVIPDVWRCRMPGLHVPVRIPAVSEIVHSRLLRGR